MPEVTSDTGTLTERAVVAPTLHDWFAHQAAMSDQAIALTADGTSLSYRELHHAAACIAGRLVAAGVRPGDLVPVFVPRRQIVPSILGVLMAGAAYVPLDPRHPDARLSGLTERVGAPVLLTDGELTDRAGQWHTGPLVLAGATPDAECPPVNVEVGPDHLAYVMFTSGSTGAPKGVEITHRNVTRLMAVASGLYAPGADDVWTMLHSFAFDFSVWEMWGALLFGGRLVVVDDDKARAPDELLRLIDDEGVTVLSQTPSALAALTSADEQERARLDRLRLIVLGGERLDPATLGGWFARRGDEQPLVVNMYGITETTVHVTHRRITVQDATAGTDSPIGVPLPDLEISLRDADGAPTPVGRVGEITISGPGLARGYFGDADTTARAFRTVSWGPEDDRRTYFSGDLARMDAHGELFYAGRRDEQVKVRGYRIELGEIGATLKAHPDVVDACVLTDTGESVASTLLAWATVRPGGPDAAALRAFLSARLPVHMVPGELRILDGLPLTPNGKVDRRALLERARTVPKSTAPSVRDPHGDSLEAAVAGIWAEELGAAEVGPTDDFFALGGHSLMVIKVVNRTRQELGADVPMRALFEAPVLADFVERVRAGSTPEPAGDDRAVSRPDPGADDTARRTHRSSWSPHMQRAPLHTQPIAVIGMAARFAGADDVESYWTNLVDCVESVSRPDVSGPVDDVVQDGEGRYVRAVAKVADVEWFDADFFRTPPAEAVTMDPQQRVLLEVAAEALEDAGYAGEREPVVGVFVGSGENHYFREFVAPAEARAGRSGDVRITLANEKDFLAPRLAFKLGLAGPAITVQTGCATALSAVAVACSALAAGDCDIALAGGVSLLMPDVDGYDYTEGGILSTDGRCRAFDADASGTVPGAGAGIVVLRRDTDAQAAHDRRRAVIRGWAVNNDGGSRAGFTVPNIGGQEAVIRSALARAGIAPDEVGHIEAHGTGTAIGDPVEFEALRRVFATPGRAPQTLTLSSVKPNIGHTDAAAGIAGLIKATLAVERATVPGTLHFRRPNPEIDLAPTPFVVTAETRSWNAEGPRIAGVSSFGLGGSNAHVVVESAAAAPAAGAARPRQVLALSARTDDELTRMRKRLADRLATTPSIEPAALADIAFTLGTGRARFTRRWAAVVADGAEAFAQLKATAETGRPTKRWSLAIHGTPGELAATGERLLVTEPLFGAAIAELTEDFSGESGLAKLAPHQAGALTALSLAWILRRLGLTFSRVDAPDWARPAAEWLAEGGDLASLDAALAACTDDSADAGSVRERVGQVLVGPSFDLSEVVATAWRAGVSIDWAAYYGDEPRGRVPLPTYPFTRRRFWLDRLEPERVEPAQRDAAAAAAAVNIADFVEQVWREVLGIQHIAHDAHFVNDLGGDSLYAVEIGARLNAGLGLDLPVDLPFIAPTIAATTTSVEHSLAMEKTS